MFNLNKCIGSCNVLSPKICVTKERKDINVKVFNMITKKNEGKAKKEHISCYCKCKFNSTTCNSKQKWNKKTCQCECKKYCECKENYSCDSSACICENCKYLKSIANTTVTECDKIMLVMDNLSTKKTNAIQVLLQ